MSHTDAHTPIKLEHLAADADDVVAMLTQHHAEGRDIHPEALPEAERLATSLRDVLQASHSHAPLDATVGDALQLLGIEGRPQPDSVD